MSLPLLEVASLLLELGADIRDGKVTDAIAVSKKLAGIAVDAIPVDMLKDSLSERDRVWADLSVDIAEAIKLDKVTDDAEKAKTAP